MSTGGPRRSCYLRCEGTKYSLTGVDVALTHGRPGPPGSHGSIDDGGSISIDLCRGPPHGREGELEAGTRLINKLNAEGAAWSGIQAHDEHDSIDVSARDLGGAELRMQVTRVSNSKRWEELGTRGIVGETLSSDVVAQELFETISKKAQRYGPVERAKLTLVVDVAELPSHTFEQVVGQLRSQLHSASECRGFEAIWIVGHRPDLVFRVDDQRGEPKLA